MADANCELDRLRAKLAALEAQLAARTKFYDAVQEARRTNAAIHWDRVTALTDKLNTGANRND